MNLTEYLSTIEAQLAEATPVAWENWDTTDIEKLVTIVKSLHEAVERNCYPHIEQFCKERSRKAIADVESIIAGER